MDRHLSPGSRIYRMGEPVTILHAGPVRTHYIPGHHAWTGCYTDELHWEED